MIYAGFKVCGEFETMLRVGTWEAQDRYNELMQDDYERAEQLKWAYHTLGGKARPDCTEQGKHYVYAVFGASDVPLYVGTGTGSRYKHATSGASNNKALNCNYYNNVHMRTVLVYDNLDENVAYKIEQGMIAFFNPSCNVMGKSDTSRNRGAGERGLSPYDMACRTI